VPCYSSHPRHLARPAIGFALASLAHSVSLRFLAGRDDRARTVTGLFSRVGYQALMLLRLARSALPESRLPWRSLLEFRLARKALSVLRLASLAKRKTSRFPLAKRKTSRFPLAKRKTSRFPLAKRNSEYAALAKRKSVRSLVAHPAMLPVCLSGLMIAHVRRHRFEGVLVVLVGVTVENGVRAGGA